MIWSLRALDSRPPSCLEIWPKVCATPPQHFLGMPSRPAAFFWQFGPLTRIILAWFLKERVALQLALLAFQDLKLVFSFSPGSSLQVKTSGHLLEKTALHWIAYCIICLHSSIAGQEGQEPRNKEEWASHAMTLCFGCKDSNEQHILFSHRRSTDMAVWMCWRQQQQQQTPESFLSTWDDNPTRGGAQWGCVFRVPLSHQSGSLYNCFQTCSALRMTSELNGLPRKQLQWELVCVLSHRCTKPPGACQHLQPWWQICKPEWHHKPLESSDSCDDHLQSQLSAGARSTTEHDRCSRDSQGMKHSWPMMLFWQESLTMGQLWANTLQTETVLMHGNLF